MCAVYVSPGVYTSILDLSLYVPQLSTTIMGMVGMASKGPVNEPMYVSNVFTFISTFGNPNPNYMGPYAALQFLRYGRQLWYTRVAGPSAAAATAELNEATTAGFVTSAIVGPFTVLSADNIVFRVNFNGHGFTEVTLTKGVRTAAQIATDISGQCTTDGQTNFTVTAEANGTVTLASTTLGTGTVAIDTLGNGSTANATLGFVAGTYSAVTATYGSITGSGVTGPYEVISGNNQLDMLFDGDSVSVTLTPSSMTSADVASAIQSAITAAGTKASTRVTSNGTAPTDGNEIKIGSQTYTFKDTLTPSAYEVHTGGTAANALINLKKAVNASGVANTDYGTGTDANPDATATTIDTTHLTFVAVAPGTAGNSLESTNPIGSTLSFLGTLFINGTPGTSIPGTVAAVTSGGNTVVKLSSTSSGTSSTVEVVGTSTCTALLGFDTLLHKGAAATSGTKSGTGAGPFTIGQNNQLKVAFDGGTVRTVVLTAGLRTASQVVAEVNLILGPLGYAEGSAAVTSNGGVKITTNTLGSSGAVQVSSAGNAQYGFGFSTAEINGTGSSGTNSLLVTAASVGTHGDKLSVTVGAGNLAGTFKLTVKNGDQAVEIWNNLSKTSTDANFSETLINGNSQWIEVTDQTNGVPASVTTLLTGGNDGISDVSDADYIGTMNPKTGLQMFANAEDFDLNVMAVPGVSSAAVINEMLLICSTRGDCMCLVDPPFGQSVQQVVDWHNGVGAYSDHQSFNSLYGALYWPWLQVYDAVNKQLVWVPPSGLVSGVYAFTDQTTETWFAPAGLNRGHLLQPLKVEHSADLGERDLLYGNQNAVNPIVNFQKDGITVYGQRSLQRKPTALDRVNVVRLVLYLRKVIATAVKYLVFEPNDPITWAQFVTTVGPYMESVKQRRGVTDYRVICDTNTNPPDAIDRNEMHGVVALKPTKAAEFIEVKFAVVNQGTKFEDLTF